MIVKLLWNIPAIKCTAELYCFLADDTTLPSDDPLRFRKNLLK